MLFYKFNGDCHRTVINPIKFINHRFFWKSMELSEQVLTVCMERCIDLAHRASSVIGRPLVGAMVVDRKGNIVGEGYKQIIRGTSFTQHAERVALDAADGRTAGSYLFTTLEPCLEKKSEIQIFCSCSRCIVKRGIKTVIVGLLENSPSMKPGSGRAYLEAAGIDVILYDAYKNRIKQELMPVLYEIPKSARQG